MVYLHSKTLGSGKAMKLGGKGKDIDSFVDQLKSEGQEVLSSRSGKPSGVIKPAAPTINTER